MNFKYYLASFGLLAGLTMTSPSLEGNAIASHKALGMGGVGVAYAQDSLSAVYNPANAVDVCDRSDIGFSAAVFDYQTKIHGNQIPGTPFTADGTYRPQSRWLYAPESGMNRHICDDVAIGFVGYARTAVKTRYNKPVPFIVGTTRPGLEFERFTLAPVFAFKVDRCGQHNFGITLDFNLQRFKVNGTESFANPNFSIHPHHVTNKGYSWAFGVGTTLGWQWHMSDCFEVGVTFRPRTRISHFQSYTGFSPQESRFDMPSLIAAGFSWRWLPCSTFAFDVTRLGVHEIRAEGNDFQDVEPAGFPEGHKLGDVHGSGFGLRNVIIYRVGIDYQLNECWTIRAGWRHDQGAIPRSQTFGNALLAQTIENYATCGATWTFDVCDRCNELTCWYAHGFEHTVKGKNSIPMRTGGGEADLSREVDAFGLEWGVIY